MLREITRYAVPGSTNCITQLIEDNVPCTKRIALIKWRTCIVPFLGIYGNVHITIHNGKCNTLPFIVHNANNITLRTNAYHVSTFPGNRYDACPNESKNSTYVTGLTCIMQYKKHKLYKHYYIYVVFVCLNCYNTPRHAHTGKVLLRCLLVR